MTKFTERRTYFIAWSDLIVIWSFFCYNMVCLVDSLWYSEDEQSLLLETSRPISGWLLSEALYFYQEEIITQLSRVNWFIVMSKNKFVRNVESL